MRIEITDVVLRDGLQDEPVVVSVEERAMIARSLIAAGVRRLEVASFVNPARVPQMIGAEELLALLPAHPDVSYSALSLNPRGVARAAAAVAVHEVNLVVSADEAHSQANAGRSTDAAVEEIAAAVAAYPGLRVTGAVSTAFVGLDGTQIPAAQVVSLVRKLSEAGLTRVGLADTLGTATPDHVDRTIAAVQDAFPEVELYLHLHNARDQALETVDRAVARGIIHFDSALGGYGGCPFAPGAHGNLATESLVRHLHDRGLETGIDVGLLAEARVVLERALADGVPVTEAG